MAINGSGKSYAFMEFPLSMSRQDAFPLDKSSVFFNLEEAKSYAANDPTAYVGQIISVVENGTSKAYQIKNEAGDLEPLGGASTEVNVATDEEIKAMLDDVFTTKE